MRRVDLEELAEGHDPLGASPSLHLLARPPEEMVDLGPLLQWVGHHDVIPLEPRREGAEGEAVVGGDREGSRFEPAVGAEEIVEGPFSVGDPAAAEMTHALKLTGAGGAEGVTGPNGT